MLRLIFLPFFLLLAATMPLRPVAMTNFWRHGTLSRKGDAARLNVARKAA